MIAKVHQGSDPGRLIAYLYDSEQRLAERHADPHMVAGTLATLDEPGVIVRELRAAAKANRAISKPVHHASLRVAAEEAGRLDDFGWEAVAERYAQRMGFERAGWVAVRHAEDHIHFVGCRVGYDGQTVSDSHNYARAMTACREIETEHGLISVQERVQERGASWHATVTGGERALAARQVASGAVASYEDPPRVHLRAAMEAAQAAATSRGEFEQLCAERGVLMRANVAPATGRMNGYSVSIEGWRDNAGEQVWLPASKVHRSLSWSKLRGRLDPDRAATAPASSTLPAVVADGPAATLSDDAVDAGHAGEDPASVAIADPLEELRGVIGEPASEWLRTRTNELAGRAGGADAPRLIAQQALGAAAWKQLDRPGAIETRRVQSAQVAAAKRAAGDQAAASALEKQAEQKRQGGGLRGRAERRGLLQKAEQLRSQAQAAHCDVEQLASAEQQLAREGRHLNDWVKQHGEPAAAGLAAERELAARRQAPAAAAGRPADVIADPELAELQRLQRAAFPTSPQPTPDAPAPARPRRTYQDRGRNDRGQGGIER